MNISVGFFLALAVFVTSLQVGYVSRRHPSSTSSGPHWQFVAMLSAVLAIIEIADERWEMPLLVVAGVGCVCYAAVRLRHRWTAK